MPASWIVSQRCTENNEMESVVWKCLHLVDSRDFCGNRVISCWIILLTRLNGSWTPDQLGAYLLTNMDIMSDRCGFRWQMNIVRTESTRDRNKLFSLKFTLIFSIDCDPKWMKINSVSYWLTVFQFWIWSFSDLSKDWTNLCNVMWDNWRCHQLARKQKQDLTTEKSQSESATRKSGLAEWGKLVRPRKDRIMTITRQKYAVKRKMRFATWALFERLGVSS